MLGTKPFISRDYPLQNRNHIIMCAWLALAMLYLQSTSIVWAWITGYTHPHGLLKVKISTLTVKWNTRYTLYVYRTLCNYCKILCCNKLFCLSSTISVFYVHYSCPLLIKDVKQDCPVAIIQCSLQNTRLLEYSFNDNQEVRFLFGCNKISMIVDKWPLYALDRAELDKSIANFRWQFGIWLVAAVDRSQHCSGDH